MIDVYWNMFSEVVFDRYYYYHVKRSYHNILYWLNLCVSGFSAISVSIWAIYNSFSTTWALIVAILQVISLSESIFPFSKRIDALCYLIPDYDRLIDEIETVYLMMKLDKYSDDEIASYIHSFRIEATAIESKYTGGIDFARKQRCSDLAENDMNKFFKSRYSNVNIKEVKHGTEQTGETASASA